MSASAANPPAGAPDWFPLRGDHLIGCAFNSPGTICRGNYHPYWAIDIKGRLGENVYAAGKGTVSQVVSNQGGNCDVGRYSAPGLCPNGSKGNYVLVDHGNGVFSYYQHLASVAVKKDDTVAENTPIGGVGDSGWATPRFYHLHFERRSGTTARVDPGPLKACIGATLTTYPRAFGAAYASWQGLPGHKFTAHSDGTACAASPTGGGKPKVDLVFAIDTTGSMSPYIAGVQASARLITASLFAKADARVALVDYKDLYADCAGDGYAARVDLPLSSDPAAFDTSVDVLIADGGCDTPESVYSGLMAAIHLPWRTGVKKAIILMGDAPPHDPEPVTGLTLASVTAAAKAVDPAAIYAININGLASPYFDDLAAQNEGQVYVAADPETAVEQITDAIATITTLVADAGGPYVGTVGESVTFDASASVATGANITQYQWDFDGNGSFDATTTLPTVTHTYSAPYTGIIGLSITTDSATPPQNATATAQVQILVPTMVQYTGKHEGFVGTRVRLGALLTDRSGAPISGAKMAFTLGTQSCAGTTNHVGHADCEIAPTQRPGHYTVTADATPAESFFRSGTAVDFTLTGTVVTPTSTPSTTQTPSATSAPPGGTTPGTATTTNQGLPATGAAPGALVVLGAVLVGLGAVVLLLLLVARRRRNAERPAQF